MPSRSPPGSASSGSWRRSGTRPRPRTRPRRSRTCPGGRDRSPRALAAPLGRVDVLHRLGELPAVAEGILDEAGALAVLVGLRLLAHLRARLEGPREGRVDVVDAKLDLLRDDAATWRDLVPAHVRDDDRAVGAEREL